jgi:predicted TIM-barrel fold metal-dependent hydrolase
MKVIPGDEERGTAADMFRRIYWDTALAWRPPILHLLKSVAGIDRVLFGSDFPYLRRDLAVNCSVEIENSPELNADESTAVLSGNALKLFPRLAALAAARMRTAHDSNPGSGRAHTRPSML